MSYYDVREAKLSILDMLKYDAIQDESGIIYKDMGRYVQLLVPMKNDKGHDTYEVYYDENGRIKQIIGHNGNSGFTGIKNF